MAIAFLFIELLLYILILTTGGELLVWSSWLSILGCFLFSLTGQNKWIKAGLACTVAADVCLVLCSPIQRLWGMVFFLGAQTCYALMLHPKPSRALLAVRCGITALAVVITIAVLGEKTDTLALVSICYYANLIVNIFAAIHLGNRRLSLALVLFLLCDTVIGLQVASGAYLPIGEVSLLHKILFMDFNLAWFFYLPSQVLISLESKKSA